MFRSTIMLALLVVVIGSPQPMAGTLQMTFYADYSITSEITQPVKQAPRNPVTLFVHATREAFISTCKQAVNEASRKYFPLQPLKEIIISLRNQELYRFEDGRIVSTHPVSTGVADHRTPTGDFAIRSKRPHTWSVKYECSMLQWMGITRNGMYGMHALKGNSYLKKLGRPASHGCIRLSPEDAITTYEWADVGTPVTIVRDFDPEPYNRPPTSFNTSTDGSDPVLF